MTTRKMSSQLLKRACQDEVKAVLGGVLLNQNFRRGDVAHGDKCGDLKDGLPLARKDFLILQRFNQERVTVMPQEPRSQPHRNVFLYLSCKVPCPSIRISYRIAPSTAT